MTLCPINDAVHLNLRNMVDPFEYTPNPNRSAYRSFIGLWLGTNAKATHLFEHNKFQDTIIFHGMQYFSEKVHKDQMPVFKWNAEKAELWEAIKSRSCADPRFNVRDKASIMRSLQTVWYIWFRDIIQPCHKYYASRLKALSGKMPAYPLVQTIAGGGKVDIAPPKGKTGKSSTGRSPLSWVGIRGKRIPVVCNKLFRKLVADNKVAVREQTFHFIEITPAEREALLIKYGDRGYGGSGVVQKINNRYYKIEVHFKCFCPSLLSEDETAKSLTGAQQGQKHGPVKCYYDATKDKFFGRPPEERESALRVYQVKRKRKVPRILGARIRQAEGVGCEWVHRHTATKAQKRKLLESLTLSSHVNPSCRLKLAANF